jgi:hypothetical protein
MKLEFMVFTLTVYRYVYYRRTRGRKQSVEKTHVDNLWSVGESIGNEYIDGFIDIQSVPKNIYLFYFVGISIGKFNISPIGKSYVMSLVFSFDRQYIYR